MQYGPDRSQDSWKGVTCVLRVLQGKVGESVLYNKRRGRSKKTSAASA